MRDLAATVDTKLVTPCDVRSDDDLDRVFAETAGLAFGGGLDVLVHSVAFAAAEDLEGRFTDTPRDRFWMAVDISAYSLVACARRAAADGGRGGGSIVTMTYLGGVRAVPHYNVMGVAKATLDASMRYLAWDLGAKQIRVNAISAGPVRTLAARSIAGFTTMEDMFEQRAPLHRPIESGDCGAAAAYLLSDDARNVTRHDARRRRVPRDGDVETPFRPGGSRLDHANWRAWACCSRRSPQPGSGSEASAGGEASAVVAAASSAATKNVDVGSRYFLLPRSLVESPTVGSRRPGDVGHFLRSPKFEIQEDRPPGVWDDSRMATTALIVDDHPSFRRFARKLLEAAGFRVVGDAGDGASALAAVRELRPDVVLLDVLLPDMTGFAVAKGSRPHRTDRWSSSPPVGAQRISARSSARSTREDSSRSVTSPSRYSMHRQRAGMKGGAPCRLDGRCCALRDDDLRRDSRRLASCAGGVAHVHRHFRGDHDRDIRLGATTGKSHGDPSDGGAVRVPAQRSHRLPGLRSRRRSGGRRAGSPRRSVHTSSWRIPPAA